MQVFRPATCCNSMQTKAPTQPPTSTAYKLTVRMLFQGLPPMAVTTGALPTTGAAGRRPALDAVATELLSSAGMRPPVSLAVSAYELLLVRIPPAPTAGLSMAKAAEPATAPQPAMGPSFLEAEPDMDFMSRPAPARSRRRISTAVMAYWATAAPDPWVPTSTEMGSTSTQPWSPMELLDSATPSE